MTANNIPGWKVFGDWFDVCKCNIPCPCTYAQTPSYGDCDGVMAYHIKNGHYGQALLDGLNVLALSYFKGNIWAERQKQVLLYSLMKKLIRNKERLYK
jgi:hypothetical protein